MGRLLLHKRLCKTTLWNGVSDYTVYIYHQKFLALENKNGGQMYFKWSRLKTSLEFSAKISSIQFPTQWSPFTIILGYCTVREVTLRGHCIQQLKQRIGSLSFIRIRLCIHELCNFISKSIVQRWLKINCERRLS